jgi:hypothetical protein
MTCCQTSRLGICRAFSQMASIIREKFYVDFSYRSAFQAVPTNKRSGGGLLKSHLALDSLDRVFAAALTLILIATIISAALV